MSVSKWCAFIMPSGGDWYLKTKGGETMERWDTLWKWGIALMA